MTIEESMRKWKQKMEEMRTSSSNITAAEPSEPPETVSETLYDSSFAKIVSPCENDLTKDEIISKRFTMTPATLLLDSQISQHLSGKILESPFQSLSKSPPSKSPSKSPKFQDS